MYGKTSGLFSYGLGYNIPTRGSLFMSASRGQQNNLIMGAAINIPLKAAYRFSRSARYSCHHCTIILLVNNISARSYDFQLLSDVFNIRLVPYESFSTIRKERAYRIMEIHSRRWIIYKEYLQNQRKLGEIFDNVFFCDVRDSVFQTNVFNHMGIRDDGLYAFMEDAQVTIEKQISNAHWIKVCYGDEELRVIGSRMISCSGTVLGTWAAINTYLSAMTFQLLNQSEACLRTTGNDQGVHNFIIHHEILSNTKIYKISHETGFVGTVGLPHRLQRNKFGLVLNSHKEIYAVVHQLDRSSQLVSQYDLEFHILSDDILDKKM